MTVGTMRLSSSTWVSTIIGREIAQRKIDVPLLQHHRLLAVMHMDICTQHKNWNQPSRSEPSLMHQVINQSTSEETEKNHLTNIILKCANNPSPETNLEISTHKSRQTHKQICLLQAWIHIYIPTWMQLLGNQITTNSMQVLVFTSESASSSAAFLGKSVCSNSSLTSGKAI